MSFWEFKLCDCGSVNNKLFQNIYPWFDAFMERKKKSHFVCVGCSHQQKFSPFQAVTFSHFSLMHESRLLARPISAALLADVV